MLRKGTPHEVATQGSVNTRMGVERCVRYAFELAASRVRASTSRSCTRPTCSPSPATCGSARSTRSPPSTRDVATAYNHVDAACIYFVQDPHRYDVVVTDNLFGDILTDLGGAVSGGIGLASSANLNPARTGPSMFEPVHGSAPDIAGTDKANPTAAILSRGADARLPRRGRRRRPHPRPRAPSPRHRAAPPQWVTPIAARVTRLIRMPITPTPKIWMNGELVDWDNARIHVLTHTLHYGTGVFEGIRAYETSQGPARVPPDRPHRASANSAKILGMESRTRSTS